MAPCSHHDVLYVRTAERAEEPRAAADFAAEGGSLRVTAETPIALHPGGPFEPLAAAVLQNGALRDELARAFAIPSLRGVDRIRWAVLAAAALPMASLLELDRELFGARAGGGHVGVGRIAIDLLLACIVVFETTRRTPRLPRIAALSLLAVALRWILVLARLCGGLRSAHPSIWIAAGLTLVAGVVFLVRVPPASRVALELLAKLGISRSAMLTATSPTEPPPALVAAAIACAAALPALLHACGLFGGGMAAQVAVFLALGAAGPPLARRWFALEPSGIRGHRTDVAALVLAVLAGLALAGAAVTTARAFFDAGTELARCVGRLDSETRTARAAESAELTRAIASVRGSPWLVALTATVFPLAEERIYRGLLQDVLARKYGRAYGIFAAAFAFGIAHVGIYHVALYQTVLLGIGFGVAYAEGGLAAAFCAHAAWNLLQLT
jgi:membrane protease YdiL (CAAX protease family)